VLTLKELAGLIPEEAHTLVETTKIPFLTFEATLGDNFSQQLS
jgi:hypothetical protein